MKVLYPGSFDPITLGHVDIIERLVRLDYDVTVLVAHSSRKQTLFTSDERVALIQEDLENHFKRRKSDSFLSMIKIEKFEGMTSDYMKMNSIRLIVRGLRAVSDYEYEMTMAQVNRKLYSEAETLFMPASPEFHFVSSRGVKEIAINGGALDHFVSEPIRKALVKRLSERSMK